MSEQFAQVKKLLYLCFLLQGAIAQLVERFNGIEEVRSSSLLSSTILLSPKASFCDNADG